MSAGPVFVLGHARSGTTLLQRVLNSYDDVLVWGEHAGIVRPLADAYFGGLATPNLFEHARPLAEVLRDSAAASSWQAWMTWLGPAEWPVAFRRMLETLFVPEGLPGKRVWGFKEIRYGAEPGDRTLAFLHALWPDARFAFVVRNPLNTFASHRRMPGGAGTLPALVRQTTRWSRRYAHYREFEATSGARCFWVVYEELVAERGAVHDLVRDLGHGFGDAQRAVIASGEGRGSSFSAGDVHERWTRLPLLWRAVLDAGLGTQMATFGYARPPLAPPVRWLGQATRRALA
ncbi:MAG: sulfotransferase [bacterium]|nr:sulfotransferase [bacterium]